MQEKQQNKIGQMLLEQWRKYAPYFVIIVGIVLTGIVYLTFVEKDLNQQGTLIETTIESLIQTSQEETLNYITVYICGAVNNPDVYTLIEGSRLVDAINLAGGFTEDAWKEGINLARVIVDAEQIYVPTEEERLHETYQSNDSGKVNLNTATKEQLMTLSGIGEAKAESILSYRKEHGSFTSIEDIMKISGIKESLFQKIKEYITI